MAATKGKKTTLETGVLRLAILGTITGLCLIVIVYLLTEVRQKLGELSSSPADNIQWTLSQLEVEYLEFHGALVHARVIHKEQPGDAAADAATLRELRKRYDILYSRFQTLSQAKLYAKALNAPSLDGAFERIRDAVFGMAETIDSPDATLQSGLASLDQQVDDMRGEVRRILSESNSIFVKLSDDTRMGVAQVLTRMALASFVLLAALSAMVILFRSLAQVSKRRLVQMQFTTARLETIFSTSRDAILVLDYRGRLRDMNEAAEEMFEISEDDARGNSASSLLRREGADGLVAIPGKQLFQACRDGPKTGYRLIGRSETGRTFPVELSMDVTDREGVAVLVCVVRNISHQVATEAELKASRDQALSGERAKARFLGVISHEMRTPLNGIMGTIDLIEENNDPTEREMMLKVVRNSAQTLLQLVNDVLDITQIEGGDVTLHPAPFDLDLLLDDILASEYPRAKALNNQLLRRGPEREGWVLGDATRLRQILLNLVSNAVKFTESGAITVTTTRFDDRLEFRISDTGIGMTDEEQARIFEDFVRLDSAVSRQIQGTGLGLGIARQLTRAMGGDISVSSHVGDGSTFTLTLPLPACDPGTPAQRSEEVVQPLARAVHILLVEDNPTNRFVARRMLERDGHTVVDACNGAEGVDAALREAFDIILMDVSMPVMGGIEATGLIRNQPGPCQQTRIVALTAHTGAEIVENLRSVGMDDVIAKPIRGAVLRRLLLEGQNSASERPGRTGRRHVMPVALLDYAILDDLLGGVGIHQIEALIAAIDHEMTPTFAPGNAPDIEAAHRLSGLAATLGAQRLATRSASLQDAMQEPETRDIENSLNDLRDCWEVTREALRNWMESQPDQPPASQVRHTR